MRLKWLHLSDIHFSFRNYSSDLLRKDFISRISELNAREEFTHLFLSGDILNQYNDPDIATTQFLKDLMAAMSIKQENVFIVPGNHDHDRNISTALVRALYGEKEEPEIVGAIDALDESSIAKYLAAFNKFNDCITTFRGNPYYSSLVSPHMIATSEGLNVIQLNTAWLECSSEESSKLFLGSSQLKKLLEENEPTLKDPAAINIAIGHHPIGDLSNTERKRVLDLFSRYNIGLYFCGHQHKPSTKYYSDEDVLEIVCHGGFNDGYSEGGYVWGIIDTDSEFYKVEFFCWNEGSWSIESKLEGTDERGTFYFPTKKFCHRSDIVAVDIKLYDGHISKPQIDNSIGCENYYSIYSNITYPADWDQQEKEIEKLALEIKRLVAENKVVHLYPLAPIPTLIRLGFELQSNSKILIHQYDRMKNRWVYDSADETISVRVTEKARGSSGLVVKVSTSVQIDDASILKTFPLEQFDTVEFVADPISIGCPLYNNGVNTIVNSVINYLNKNQSKYNSIFLFAAIPAGLSVELGRKMLKSIYSNVHLYNYSSGIYEEAFILNPIEKNIESHIENVVFAPEYSKNIIYLPIAGDVACGNISEAIESTIELFPVSRSILSSGDYYYLRAKGDSMVNAGIEEGDLVLIKYQNTANDGEIVVARVESETTLKRMFHDSSRKRIILRAENDSYRDQEYSDVDIQGVAVKVIKSLNPSRS